MTERKGPSMTERKFKDGDIVFVPKDGHYEIYKYSLMFNGDAYWRQIGTTTEIEDDE